MEPSVRRHAIVERLEAVDVPISATTLAQEFQVSRQVIVGDVALLRAGGLDIQSTPRGYLLSPGGQMFSREVACQHSQEDMGAELNLLVDCGCTVVDVTVEHPVYGQLTGALQLENRFDVASFLERIAGQAPLSTLTHGIHLHTISGPSVEVMDRGVTALSEAGFLVKD